jgi:hypothetical protein
LQNYDAGKPGEFLSVFTDTVELTYAQAAEAHVAAHPVWARRAPRIVSSSSDIGCSRPVGGTGGPSVAEAPDGRGKRSPPAKGRLGASGPLPAQRDLDPRPVRVEAEVALARRRLAGVGEGAGRLEDVCSRGASTGCPASRLDGQRSPRVCVALEAA